jgi:hypothetical protein
VPFVVCYDACVLHPAPLRDLLIRLDQKGLVHPDDFILDTLFLAPGLVADSRGGIPLSSSLGDGFACPGAISR